MNPDYQNKKLPLVVGQKWEDVFPKDTDPLAIDLVSKMLRYNPS